MCNASDAYFCIVIWDVLEKKYFLNQSENSLFCKGSENDDGTESVKMCWGELQDSEIFLSVY